MSLTKKLFDVAEDFRPIGRPILTGIKDFDEAMDGGIRGGELITVSGESGRGKTSWLVHQTRQITESGVPTLWFTYEMNPWHLKEKFLALGAKDDLNTYVPIEHNGNTAEWLEDRILDAHKNFGCKVIFIDHLHYLIPPNQEQNSSMLIGGVARKIKQLAIKTDTIIYLVAHARRLQMGEKLSASSIRDSALIANESDYVFLIDRLKRKTSTKKLGTQDMNIEEEDTNVSVVTLAKNRRTGRQFKRFFEVNDGHFDLLGKDKYSWIKDNCEL